MKALKYFFLFSILSPWKHALESEVLMVAYVAYASKKNSLPPPPSPQNVFNKCNFSGEDILLEGYLGDHPESNYLIFHFSFCYCDLLWYLGGGGK